MKGIIRDSFHSATAQKQRHLSEVIKQLLISDIQGGIIMESYLIPIKWAIILFPMLAAFITVPYVLVQYKKYGAIPMLRTLIVYSFALYMLVAYFLVILPLPKIDDVAAMTSARTQFVPFQFVRDFLRETCIDIKNPATWLTGLKQNCFLQPVFNLLFFLPFGVYMRYYFRLNLRKTVLFSFLLSLFFELTQLTGLYGIYPRGYRLFDVDDLMINTLGGLTGYFTAAVFAKILPSRKAIDERAYELAERVTFFRRLTATLVDWFIIGSVTSLLSAFGLMVAGGSTLHIGGLSYFLVVACYFVLLPYKTGGYTVGKKLVNIRLTSQNGGNPELKGLLIRYGIIYGLIVPIPVYCICLFGVSSLFGVAGVIAGMAGAIALAGIFLIAVLHTFAVAFKLRDEFAYETYSRIRNVNTVKEPGRKSRETGRAKKAERNVSCGTVKGTC